MLVRWTLVRCDITDLGRFVHLYILLISFVVVLVDNLRLHLHYLLLPSATRLFLPFQIQADPSAISSGIVRKPMISDAANKIFPAYMSL